MALVIVLGLIALLIISSVTFAILMRVERAGAANARNTIMARQVVKGALSYAIAAIDNDATNRYPVMYMAGYDKEVDNDPVNSQTIWHGMKADTWNSPYWTAHTDPLRPSPTRDDTDTIRNIRFWKDTLGSIDHTIGGQFASFRADSRIMVQSAENYLPYGIRHRAYAQYFGNSDSGEKVSSEWIPVATRMPKDDTDLGDVVGRYAFLAFDTTGAPDLTAIATKGDISRGMGVDPAEIQLVSGFFDGTTSSSFKKKLQGKVKRFDNVAEIIAANQGGQADDGTSFAERSSYSAYSYCLPDLAPRKSDAENDKKSDGKRFRDKVNIGGDGDAAHIKHLKNHRARIMKAFYDSGLTASSLEYNKGVVIKEEACKDCGTDAYKLPEECNSEQALWAYLGLVDYIDADNDPFYDDGINIDEDIQKYARPVTENMVLFNGYFAMVRFICLETYAEEPVRIDTEEGTRYEMVKVFSPTNADYAVEFDGKIYFANRTYPDVSEDKMLDANEIEGRIGLEFGESEATSSSWPEAFVKKVDDIYGASGKVVADGNVTISSGRETFDAGEPLPRDPSTFSVLATNRLPLSATLDVPSGTDAPASNQEKLLKAPSYISVGAVGGTYSSKGNLIHVVPPSPSVYDSEFLVNDWLSSFYSPEKESRAAPSDWAEIDRPNVKVYRTRQEAEADILGPKNGPQYPLHAWAYDVVLWGEMLDPRFLESGSSVTMDAHSDADALSGPRVAFVSHRELDDGTSMADYSTAGSKMRQLGFDAGKFIDMMLNRVDFEEYRLKFRRDEDRDEAYFCIEDGYFGYSIFQEFLLTNPEVLKDHFKGHTDGSRLSGSPEADDLDSQWHTLYARNAPLATVGELGNLPIGPWATIRLCGTKDEADLELEPDSLISLFNGFPKQTYTTFQKTGKKVEPEHEERQRPFHAVLDYFTLQARDDPAFGLVNLNTPDPNVMASVFNGVPLWAYHLANDDEDLLGDPLSEADALKLADSFRNTWLKIGKANSGMQKGESTPFTRLSEMGWMFSDDDLGLADNRQREAVICNSCGLFTTRGQTYTILLRGEAYSPLFGKTTVMDGDGTTLASRRAIAQIWRDTYEDDEGNHPVFVQFFKIFDE